MLKKAQMEIMGLAMIVILLSIGMLFAVSYMVNKPASDTKKTYTYSETASTLLGAVLKSSSQCKGTSFSELFYDCANFGKKGSIQCNETHWSCDYLNETLTNILNATLINLKYELTATTNMDTKVININNKCNSKFGQMKLYPLPLHPSPGTLFIKLRICD